MFRRKHSYLFLSTATIALLATVMAGAKAVQAEV